MSACEEQYDQEICLQLLLNQSLARVDRADDGRQEEAQALNGDVVEQEDQSVSYQQVSSCYGQ